MADDFQPLSFLGISQITADNSSKQLVSASYPPEKKGFFSFLDGLFEKKTEKAPKIKEAKPPKIKNTKMAETTENKQNMWGAIAGSVASIYSTSVNAFNAKAGDRNLQIAEANARAAEANAKAGAPKEIFGVKREYVFIAGGILAALILFLVLKKPQNQ